MPRSQTRTSWTPITITPTFSFRANHPEDEELRQRLEQTLAFGGRVELPVGCITNIEIQASEEARLLFSNGDPKTSEFTIFSTREQLERPVRCSYQVLSGDGDG